MRRKQKRRYQLVSAILAGLVLIGILLALNPPKEITTFKDGFNVIKSIDRKYDTSFRTEQLNWSMAPFEVIDNITESLDNLNLETAQSPDKEALQQFIKARKMMLRSQKNWYLAEGIGHIGEVNDEDGFSCAEYPYIIKAALYYNTSWIIGLHATREMDTVISDYKDVEGVLDLVGVNENKMKFYSSPLYQAADHFRNNLFALERHCGFDFQLSDEALKIIDV